MTRRGVILLATLAVLFADVSLVALPSARAGDDKDGKDGKGQQDGRKDKDGKGKGKGKDGKDGKEKDGEKEKDPKDTPEWKACAAIAAEFRAADAAALAARIRPKGTATISLDESGTYSAEQAAPVLERWFKGKMDLTVEVNSVKDHLATCRLTYRPQGAGPKKTVERTLLIRIEPKGRAAGGGFHLVSLSLV